MYAVGMLFCNIMTALTPVAARTSYLLLVAARVIEGLGQVRNYLSHVTFFSNKRTLTCIHKVNYRGRDHYKYQVKTTNSKIPEI